LDENGEFDITSLITDESCCIFGEPGNGKTGIVVNFIKKINKAKSILVLAFQNSVIEDYQSKGVLDYLKEPKDLSNFHKFFGYDENGKKNENKKARNINDYDILIVEEGFAVPKWLLKLLIPFEGQFIFVGDNMQFLPIEEDNVKYDYLETDFLKEKCSYRKLIVPWTKEKSRLTLENYKMVQRIRNEGILPKQEGMTEREDIATKIIYSNNENRIKRNEIFQVDLQAIDCDPFWIDLISLEKTMKIMLF
jgi:hypothetical protein